MAAPFLIVIVFGAISLVNAVLPLSLGCSMDMSDSIIRCRSNNLDYIVKSMFILVPERTREAPVEAVVANNESAETTTTVGGLNSNGSTKLVDPRELDIFYCDVPELPNIFARFNNSLERVRVARSNVQTITINAFEGLENKLRNLDLSGNKLFTVPLAIQNLTRLEVFNLQDNKIQVIAEGPTFYNTVHLRELHLSFNNLGYIDNSKLQLYPASQRGTNRKSPNHTPIGLTVFNLGNTTSSLEILSLRGNDMHSYPEQLMAEFPRLKSLDLSFNSLVELPEDAFRSMPELQLVNLDSNFIRTLKFTSLPETLKLFTMKNNPMRCDCDVKWILEWIFTNTSLTVLLPKCNAPFHLREISFLRLTRDKLCNQSHVARQTVYVTDRDLGYFPLGVFQSILLREVHGEFKSMFVSWKVDPQFYLSQREWLIIYRSLDDSIYTFNSTPFTSKSYVENQTDWTTVERVFNDNIRNLSAGEFYQVCLALVENNINYIHLNHCQVAQTEKDVKPHFAQQDITQSQVTTTTEAAPTPDYLIESSLSKIEADIRSITVFWNVIVQSGNSFNFYKEQKNVTENGSTGGNRHTNYHQAESPLVLNSLTAIYNELRWKITYRRFSAEGSTAVTIMKNNYVVTKPNTHRYTIANLLPGTGYTVCFETLNDPSFKGNILLESGEKPFERGTSPYVALDSADGAVCKEVQTIEEKPFPTTEVAIASTITAAITAVLLVSLFIWATHIIERRKCLVKEDDVENVSQNTANTDTGNVHEGHEDEDEMDSEEEEQDDDDLQKPNGHLKKWPSYPKVTSIFPTEAYRNGVYHSSFRQFNGIPTYASTQRNGTYPKSILKKSPSAPSLCEANKPIPILKRPSSMDSDSTIHKRGDVNLVISHNDPCPQPTDGEKLVDLVVKDPAQAHFEASARNGEVELKKIFMTNSSESDSDSEKPRLLSS